VDNFETIRDFALEHGGEPKAYRVKGKIEPFPCVIRVMAGIDEELSLQSDGRKRAETFSTLKSKDFPDGRLPVQLPMSVIQGYEDRFPNVTVLPDGERVEFNLLNLDEVMAATGLQHALMEPELSWPEAVVFLRMNGKLGSKILSDFRKLNEDDAVESAKND
jgi:hypothetical protein